MTAHGTPRGVLHTRPIGVTAHATDPRLIPEQINPFARVHVPAACSPSSTCGSGSPATMPLGFAVHVPQYLVQTEFADGAVTALNAITAATGLNLPIDDRWPPPA